MVPWLIRLITGAYPRWRGIDPVAADGSFPQRIYFANHTSNLDAPVIWASLPTSLRKKTRPVAARDYWEKGPVRRYLSQHIFRALLIERTKVTARNNPLSTMEAALNEGDSLIIFPEGTRSMDEDGEVGEFKPGIWHLAKKHPNVQLVPVHLENLNRVLPKGDFLLVPLLAAVTFGASIQINEGEDKMAFLARAKRCVCELESSGEDA